MAIDAHTVFHAVAAFQPAGFRGALTYYRDLDQIILDMPRLVPQLHETATVDGAGHWLHRKRPGIVNDVIRSFADTVGADTAS